MGTWSKDLLVCLLPRVSMIKQNSNNVTIKVRYLTYNHSIKKFCMKNTLTNQWRAYQTLVVNLPMIENTINMPKMILHKCSASTPRAKYKDKRLKVILSQESELCYLKWGSTSSTYIIQMTFNYKNRSLKQPTTLT